MEHAFLAPTARISGLCHSIARIEPYNTCQLGCAYCYARWYRGPHGEPQPLGMAVRIVRMLARLRRTSRVSLPGRLATLSDPFQPAERTHRASLEVLREAYRQHVPIILNTRMHPPTAEHWEAVERLASEGLLLAQVTITGLSEDWAWLHKIEPGSPHPAQRLSLVKELAGRGLPVVVRIQPLIPGTSFWRDPHHVCEIRRFGARGVIVEVLRSEKKLYEQVFRLTGVREPLERYARGASVYSVAEKRKASVLRSLAAASIRCGLGFQTCKEGYPSLHAPRRMDCCYMGMLGVKVSKRPTLVDLYWAAKELGRIPVDRALGHACSWVEEQGFDPLCSWRPGLPGWLRRVLRRYERMMLRVLERRDVASRIVPDLLVGDGYVEARV